MYIVCTRDYLLIWSTVFFSDKKLFSALPENLHSLCKQLERCSDESAILTTPYKVIKKVLQIRILEPLNCKVCWISPQRATLV